MGLGVFFSLVIGFGLMALTFYSSRQGYDDLPQAKVKEPSGNEPGATDSLWRKRRETHRIPALHVVLIFRVRLMAQSSLSAQRRARRTACSGKARLAAVAAASNKVSPKHAELLAATRLAADHGGLYGPVDLAGNDIRGLLDRVLPA